MKKEKNMFHKACLNIVLEDKGEMYGQAFSLDDIKRKAVTVAEIALAIEGALKKIKI